MPFNDTHPGGASSEPCGDASVTTAPQPPQDRGRRPARGEPVIDRALSLLAAFDAGRRSLTLGELARQAGIPTSTTLRLAGRLVAWGALERDKDGRFTVGLRLWEVASLAPRAHGLREISMPFMTDLQGATGAHVLLAVRDGEAALLLERLSPHAGLPAHYRVGGRLPLHSTGEGLVLLAYADSAYQERVLAEPLVLGPKKGALSPAALRRTLAEVRREGVATTRCDAPEPLVTVAAPIFGSDDQVVAALSAVVGTADMKPRLLWPAVRMAARSISRGLGARRSIGSAAGPAAR
jgi:DNA-binding IclR family transcriptional regulator